MSCCLIGANVPSTKMTAHCHSLKLQFEKNWSGALSWQAHPISYLPGIPWNFVTFDLRLQSVMEFPGIVHGFPWNLAVIWKDGLLVERNSMELGDGWFSGTMELHGNLCHLEWHPPNSMKLRSRQIRKWPSSMELHGTLQLLISDMAISNFHGNNGVWDVKP